MCCKDCCTCACRSQPSLTERLARPPAVAVYDLTSVSTCAADANILSKLQTGIFQLDNTGDLRVIQRVCERVHAKQLPEPYVLYGCSFTNETLAFVIEILQETMWHIAQLEHVYA